MKECLFNNFPHVLHGADYNPEQWLETKEVWDEDMRLMKIANCNEMTVGIFSWSTLEPEEGKYDFSFLDEIIEKIYKNGGRVILATPSGARPRWLAEKYPEVLRVAETGVRNLFGERHNHCYTSPVYREKVRSINALLSKRYGKHPAVLAWHISNEYGGACNCEFCKNQFRTFLRERYGTVEKLNKAWWTTFWSHTYTDFEQVEPPSEMGDSSLKGLNLDWRRFVSHQTVDFMSAEIEAIKEYSDLPVTTNMMPFAYATDYWKFAEKLDFASTDSYPEWHAPHHLWSAAQAAFWYDFFRCMKQKPFLLMESAPGLVSWRDVNKLKRPNMDKISALQAIAHGADSVQYFQWRKSRGACEQWHGAVVDHVGRTDTRVFKAVKETGELLKKLDGIVGTKPVSKVAIIFDWENMWAINDASGFVKDKAYRAICVDYYKALWERGIGVDILPINGDLEKYDLIVAPMLYMTDKATISALKKYVEGGGTLYATYLLGMVNETTLSYLGGFPANELKDVFGIWNEEIDALYPQERIKVAFEGAEYEGRDMCELVHANTAKVLATYASEFYKGSPAFTVNEYGKGKAYYQAFRDCGDFWLAALDEILKELNIVGVLGNTVLPKGVTAHIRTDGEKEYLFVENYTENSIQEIPLSGKYFDIEKERIVSEVSLYPFGLSVLTKIDD